MSCYSVITSGSVRIDFNIQTKSNKYYINLLNNFIFITSIIKSYKRFHLVSMNKKYFYNNIYKKNQNDYSLILILQDRSSYGKKIIQLYFNQIAQPKDFPFHKEKRNGTLSITSRTVQFSYELFNTKFYEAPIPCCGNLHVFSSGT